MNSESAHSDLEHSLRQLPLLEAEYEASRQGFESRIKALKEQIEVQTFAVFPGIQERVDYWGGDPIRYSAGIHEVILQRDKGELDVEIERQFQLEVEGDLFEEAPVREGVLSS